MTFQTQGLTLNYEPLSDNDKYIIEMAGYRKQGLTSNENISRPARGTTSPSYI